MSLLQILEIVVKSSLLAGVALLLVTQVKHLSAAQRASIAHFGLLAALFVPLQVLFGPNIEIAGPWTRASTEASSFTDLPAVNLEAATNAPSSFFSGLGTQDAAFLAYAAIAIVFALLLVVGLFKLARLQHDASILTDVSWLSALAQAQHRMGFKQGAALLHSDGLASPVSWGVMRPTIMLSPAAINAPDKAEAIIAHELAHVSRMDWLNLLIGRLATALYWFNPLVWMLSWQAHELREEAADDVVLRGPVQSSDYAALLVEFARGRQPRALAAHAVSPGKTWLKRRLTRVLDHNVRRDPAAPAWTAGCAAIALTIGGSLGAFTPAATASAPMQGEQHVSARLLGADTVIASLHAPFSSRELSTLSGAGVTPEWFAQMAREVPEVRSASANDIAALSALHVSPAWVRNMRQVGYADLNIDEMTALTALDVDADYVTQLASAGYRALPVAQLEDLAAHDLDASAIRAMTQNGRQRLSVAQLSRAQEAQDDLADDDEDAPSPPPVSKHHAGPRRHPGNDPPSWPPGVPRPPTTLPH